MQLEVYKKSDFYEDYISSKKEYYERENADAYFAERLAEKDAEIVKLKVANKLLKEHIANGDVSRITWIDEVIELKQKLQDHCSHCPVKEQEDDVVADLKAKLDKAIAERDGNQVCIDALKAKLESVQTSMYADVVDANMENRKLRRALWIARALRAKECKYKYETWERHEERKVYKDYDMIAIVSRKARMWRKIERTCIKKAEEYK